MSGVESAKAAGLHYVVDGTPGLRRVPVKSGFVYRDAKRRAVRDTATLKRVRGLVLPPAWIDVWIAADPLAHLQATGRDAAGRKQYRYHSSWTTVRDATKFHRMLDFAKALPSIRRRVARDLRGPAQSRARVTATVIRLLERTHIRIGNEEYAKANGSHGLTTLRGRHVSVRGGLLRFAFKAKSGVRQTVDLRDVKLARAVREIQDLPGQMVFQYVADDGSVRVVSSGDVNEYLHTVAGGEFTAKDFRTWAGTVAAARALAQLGVAPSKTAAATRTVVAAIDRVAHALGNTRAVSRNSYIHPAVVHAYHSGVTINDIATTSRDAIRGLRKDEVSLMALLRRTSRRRAA